MGVTQAVIRQGRKFDQVLEGAREVFLAHGFEGAGVDDIARAAGVSKATLYSYFPDKRLLFMEVARRECIRQAEEAMAVVDPDLPARELLRFAAGRMIDFFNSDLSLGIFRMCIAESERFPQFAREFYEAGPLSARSRLADFLAEAAAKGQLEIEDPLFAADQFAELCKSQIFNQRIFGIRDRFTRPELDRIADEAVKTFMARYGTVEAGHPAPCAEA